MQRRRFKETAPLDQRLAEEAKGQRKEAEVTPYGIERERLDLKARQAETALHINEWISSPGLRPPT